ncbi:GPP34 family phosphoprotein [soil metagenome]
MLNLAEELLLLALEAEKGVVHQAASDSLSYALSGAVLMELILNDRLRTKDDKLVVADGSRTGDEVLDSALRDVEQSRKARDLEYWVSRWGGQYLKDKLIERLVKRGTLREEEHRVLWIFSQSRYPERDGVPEKELRDRVRAVVLEKQEPERRLAALVCLIKACDLAGEVFASHESELARKRLEEIAEGDLVSNAVSDAVSQVQAATQAAVMASVTAATAASAASCSTTTTTC